MWILYYIGIFTLKRHKNFTDNLPKQNKSSGGNVHVPGLIYKERSVLLTVHKLFEHFFFQNWLKFYYKMDLSIRMRIIYNVNHRYAIHLKLETKLITSLTKLVLQVKSGICSTIIENLLLYCRKSSAFIAVVII